MSPGWRILRALRLARTARASVTEIETQNRLPQQGVQQPHAELCLSAEGNQVIKEIALLELVVFEDFSCSIRGEVGGEFHEDAGPLTVCDCTECDGVIPSRILNWRVRCHHFLGVKGGEDGGEMGGGRWGGRVGREGVHAWRNSKAKVPSQCFASAACALRSR